MKIKDFKEVILNNKEDFIKQIETIGIVGAGSSGISLAFLAKKLGKRVKLTDINKNLPQDRLDKLTSLGVKLELGLHSQEFLKDTDLIILSPGVDTQRFLSKVLTYLNIPYVGEIEFSSWFCKAKDLIAITGTNGKTTTTYLLGKILEKYLKRRVYILGNIGNPFSECVLNIKEDDLVVLEVSSFQLETIFKFKPFIACLLNFSQDHLDRYPDLNSYFEAKKRIFMNQDPFCYALFPEKLKDKLKIRAKKIVVEGDDIISFIEKIVGIYGVDKKSVSNYLKDFKGLPHRLEFVAQKREVTFINDSKATNISSTLFALKRIKGKIILIAGGKDKGLDYSLVKPYLGNVKKIFLIGQAKDRIRKCLEGFLPMEEASSLEEAVYSAYKEAEPKDVVLLSPMCSSFDMFKDYKERGDVFRQAVYKL